MYTDEMKIEDFLREIQLKEAHIKISTDVLLEIVDYLEYTIEHLEKKERQKKLDEIDAILDNALQKIFLIYNEEGEC